MVSMIGSSMAVGDVYAWGKSRAMIRPHLAKQIGHLAKAMPHGCYVAVA
jgi:hypothetical protein